MKNLAVFVSGSGTNLENLAVKIKKGKLTNCQIALVVSDNPVALALKRAENYKLKTLVVCRKDFTLKEDFEAKIVAALKEHKIDFIVLAGFMRILSSNFVKQFHWKIINIHPALLPSFPGAHAIQDAWEAKAKETGVTVHFVNEGVDTGPIILQRNVMRILSDTLETFEQKIHEVEYELYPKAIQLLVDDRLAVKDGKVYCDGKQLTTVAE